MELKDSKLTEKQAIESADGGEANGFITVMECKHCSHRVRWEGDYYKKGPYLCQFCGYTELYGIELHWG